MAKQVANTTDSYPDRVRDRRDALAPAERRVADMLLALEPEAMLLSAAALADQLGTSDATIVRTAKSLGYDGLAAMRRAIAASGDNPALGERLRRTIEHTAGDDFFTTTVRDHLSAVETLTHNVSPPAFRAAVSVLARAERVVWRGVGPSAHLAAYGQLITERIGKPSRALVHTGTSFADELLTVGPGDAVVLFAYGRLQSHVRVLVARAELLDVPVVLVTDSLARRLEAAVTTTLECGRGMPGLFASHAVTLVVVEALVLAVAAASQEDAEASLATLNELRAALAGRRIDVDAP
jgi:DNA-binding MurR/RpiR family transcriptional regulator